MPDAQAATGAVVWAIVEWIKDGKPTTLGVASGGVAALVGITPAAGFVGVMGAIVIGLLAGALLAATGARSIADAVASDFAPDVAELQRVALRIIDNTSAPTAWFAASKRGGKP